MRSPSLKIRLQSFIIPDKSKTFAEIENADTKTTVRKNIKETGFEIELSGGNYLITI